MTSAAKLEDIAAMARVELVTHWTALTGAPPPPRTSTPLIRRVVAYQTQARAMGDLSPKLQRELKALGSETVRKTAPSMEPGGRFIREWNGVRHVVEAGETGYCWQGQSFRSLSAVAKAITGAHWSGPRFFGLAGPRS
jgi:Protein of unknown function (DUF2924)